MLDDCFHLQSTLETKLISSPVSQQKTLLGIKAEISSNKANSSSDIKSVYDKHKPCFQQ